MLIFLDAGVEMDCRRAAQLMPAYISSTRSRVYFSFQMLFLDDYFAAMMASPATAEIFRAEAGAVITT